MDFHPNRAVLFAMLGVIIGAAIQFAIQDLVSPNGAVDAGHFSWLHFLTTIVFIFNAINFYHGKSNTLNDREYVQALFDRPNIALWEFLLTTSVILCFGFLAFDLNIWWRLFWVSTLCRALDIALIALVLAQIEFRSRQRRTQQNWLWIDVVVIAVMSGAYYLARGDSPFCVSARVQATLFWHSEQDPAVIVMSSAYIFTSIGDVIADYGVLNTATYTENAPTWNDVVVADDWDSKQGNFGDLYREHLIVPALVAIVENSAGGWKAKRILDVGCGNGCVSRALLSLRREILNIMCIDKSIPLLKHCVSRNNLCEGLARQMEVGENRPVDICSRVQWRAAMGEQTVFDLAIACFTLQDCEEIETPLREINRYLKEDGVLIVVHENENAFSPEASHSVTRRRPWSRTRSDTAQGKGEKWILTWDAKGSGEPRVQTITRFWSSRTISNVAVNKAGFSEATVPAVEFSLDSIRATHDELVIKNDSRHSPEAPIVGRVEARQLKIVDPVPTHRRDFFQSYKEAPRFSVLVLRKPRLEDPASRTAGSR